MRWLCAAFMLLVANGMGAAQTQSYDRKLDEDTLRRANIKTDAPGLVEFFRARTLSKSQVDELAAIVSQLGDPLYVNRTKAVAQLLRHGATAKPLLLKAADEENLEVARRAELCLRQIADNNEAALASSAARLLAKYKPPEAVAALMGYVPFASDASVVQAISETLPSLVDPKQLPQVLLDGLTDDNATTRAVAAEVIVKSGVAPLPDEISNLLKDPAPQVRLRVALALLGNREKQAVPVLIELLGKLTSSDVWEAEDALLQVAGTDSPKVHVGITPAAKVRAAWDEWWRKNEATVDLAKYTEAPPMLGLTLISSNDPQGTTGRVVEMTRDRQKLWEITGLRYPVDAQVIGPDRVLIAEYLNRQVTERDFKGNILWTKQVLMPIRAQRLRNGDTFIGTRRQLLIFDRDGREKFTYTHGTTSITAAERLRDGRMVIISSGGVLEILDASGKLQKRFQVDPVYSLGGNIEALPDGRFLVPLYSKNLVAEYNANGEMVWKASVANPSSVSRLPNGNTLVISMTAQRVIELNRAGEEVWSCPTQGRPWRARRR